MLREVHPVLIDHVINFGKSVKQDILSHIVFAVTRLFGFVSWLMKNVSSGMLLGLNSDFLNLKADGIPMCLLASLLKKGCLI